MESVIVTFQEDKEKKEVSFLGNCYPQIKHEIVGSLLGHFRGA